MASPPPTSPYGRRLLSLDGGGVRGLSSLIILKRLMYLIRQENDPYRLPKPADYFDMIGGTSTGGLIAIMLGRLNMGVQECIDKYCSIAENVFQERPFVLPCISRAASLLGVPRFEAWRLEEEVKELVNDRLGTGKAKLHNILPDACKVFVCAVRSENTSPCCLRSYGTSKQPSSECSIWEAARATSAAPTFFAPIQFGTPLASYSDGGLHNNNPISVLISEAYDLWGNNVKIDCAVSIGTGRSAVVKLRTLGHQIARACISIATSADKDEHTFLTFYPHLASKPQNYFRFNVTSGLETVQLDEWFHMNTIDACTQSYLTGQFQESKACADILSQSVVPLSPSPVPVLPSNPQYELVPDIMSPYFTDRQNIVTEVASIFNQTPRDPTEVVVIHGMGGVGKTQVALNYINKHRSMYYGVFFIDATTLHELSTTYLKIMGLLIAEEQRMKHLNFEDATRNLGFSGLTYPSGRQTAQNYEQVVSAVKRWFCRAQGHRFLLVFDSADLYPTDEISCQSDTASTTSADPENEVKPMALSNYIPHGSKSDVIITTRNRKLTHLGQHALELEPLTVAAAVTLLMKPSKRAIQNDGGAAWKQAEKIVSKLGLLPLAIDQAGCYIATRDPELSHFLPMYEVHWKEILSRPPLDDIKTYGKSAWTTWEMSFTWMLKYAPAAASWLCLLSFLYNNDICPQLYRPSPDSRGASAGTCSRKWLATEIENAFSSVSRYWVVNRDPFILYEAFGILVTISLVKRESAQDTFMIHPIVHMYARERLSDAEKAIYARDAVLFIARALPNLEQYPTPEAWKTHRRLLAHMDAANGFAQKYLANGPHKARDAPYLHALGILASSYKALGHYGSAEVLLRQILEERVSLYETSHPLVLQTKESLAFICDRQGRLEEGEALYSEILDARERAIPPEERLTLNTVNDLAGIYDFRGKVEQAEEFYKRALEGRRKIAGDDDPSTLSTLAELGSFYDHIGQLEKAEELLVEALRKREQILGLDDPQTIASVMKLAGLNMHNRKLQQAEQLYERAWESRQKRYGPRHPETLQALNNLAGVYFNFNCIDLAEQTYKRVLEAREAILGADHPDSLWTKCALGGISLNQGNVDQAKDFVTTAVNGLRDRLGDQSPDTLWATHNLAIVYETAGDLREAEGLHVKAVDGYQQILGPEDPNTLYAMNDLAACYERQGLLDMAQQLFQKVYGLKERRLGKLHPDTLYTANCVAGGLWSLGRAEEAESWYKETLQGLKITQQEQGADASWALSDYGDFLFSQKRFDKAWQIYSDCKAARKTLPPDHPDVVSIDAKLEACRKQRMDPSSNSSGLEGFVEGKARALPHPYCFCSRRRREEHGLDIVLR